jgi:pyridoxine kinase
MVWRRWKAVRAVKILSVQSWVADGHVGNAASLFALQRLGAEVAAIHTVQFSNHPGHGAFTGRVYPAEDISALLLGLSAHGTLTQCDALLTGYAGTAETGAALLRAARLLRQARPDALWCCDPVMGDDGRLYVKPDLPDFFAREAAPLADIMTPNQFELGLLTGLPVGSMEEVRHAAVRLSGRLRPDGPGLVLVTSVATPQTPPGRLKMLLASRQGGWLVGTDLLPAKFSGAGDLLAALYLFHFLSCGDPVRAAERASGSLAGVLRRTWQTGAAELRIVAAQDELVAPLAVPVARALGGEAAEQGKSSASF